MSKDNRVFLLVLDDTPELKPALRYACLRALRTHGRVAMLHVLETGDYQVWAGVNRLLDEEARKAAETLVHKYAEEAQKMTGDMPVLYMREGDRREALMKLIEEEPSISVLVLGAATGPKGPGPLVSELTSKYVGKLRVPVTIVPGNLSDAEIEDIA